LKESDIIHFCGGSVIYLICLIKERGFDKLIVEYVKKDKIIYTGTSAGSMIVADDLTIDAYDPDEKEFGELLFEDLGQLPVFFDDRGFGLDHEDIRLEPLNFF